jgi:MFS family permease
VTPIADALYRLTLSLWVGGMAIFTFLVTPILFRSLGRDEAGRIVGLYFPAYFTYNLVLAAAALAAFFLLSRRGWRAPHWVCAFLLALAVASAGFLRFGYYPRAQAVKARIASFETVPASDPLRQEFSRLHGASMGLNLFLLADGALLLLLAPAVRRT